MKKSKTRKISRKTRKITRNNRKKKAGTKKAVKPKGAYHPKIPQEYLDKKFGKNREDFIYKYGDTEKTIKQLKKNTSEFV